MEYLKITLLGTGTSQGVPVIGCKCDVCTSEDLKDNRLRTSILIETICGSVVIDTGPDFRTQMLREDVQSLDAIVYTHEHKDHVAGMDDVRAFNQIQHCALEVWANKDVEKALRRDFFYAFGNEKHGGLPQVNINSLGLEEENNGFYINKSKWTLLPVKHAQMDVYGFRVGDFAYITDVNFIPDSTYNKLAGVRVLVISALRKERHPSHFSLDEVLQVVERIKPEATYLTHLSHFIGKHEDLQAELPEGVFVGWDGCVIDNLNKSNK
ncbi:MAG: MBL fold metallo-hydrolase [Bacteroidetes bacterium]|nr:MAG: MBL fold metallo-hydrolase [Bacteroidota bacterium]